MKRDDFGHSYWQAFDDPHAVPELKRSGGGWIIIVSSINGTRTFTTPGATAYTALHRHAANARGRHALACSVDGKVSPAIVEIVDRRSDKTIFTLIVPPVSPKQPAGTWQDYYRKWDNMTIERLGPELVDVIPELKRYIPPAKVFDKMSYSPWFHGNLHL